MPDAVTIFGDAKAGQLRIDNLPALTRWLAQLPDGTRLRGRFEVTDLSRREKLVKFYFVVLTQAGEHCGNDLHEMHVAFWSRLQPNAPPPLSSVESVWPLDDGLLSRYVQDCVRLSAEYGCVIAERS